MTAPQLGISTTTNRITTSGYAYDANGNLTDDSLHDYVYDAENRLVTVDSTAAAYTYDGGSLRVKKQVGSTATVYIFSGSKVIAEYVNGSLNKEYIYSGSQLVATIAGSTTTYSHGDHLSVRVRRDASGGSVGDFGHLPFGDIWYETGTADKWKFTSYERDSESSLDYAIFRFDSWRLGRFMSPDRVAGNTGNPQSLNRYSYVNGDPINLIDPLGLDEHSLNCMWDENRGCIAQAPGGGSTSFGSDCGYGTLSEILSASCHGGSDAFHNAVYGDANAIDTMQGHYFSLPGKANPIAQGIAVHQGMIDITRYQATNPKGGYYDIIVYCGGHDLSSFVCLPPPEAMPGSQPFIVGPIFQSQFRAAGRIKQAEKDLTTIARGWAALEGPIVKRVLLPMAMVGAGGTVAGAGVFIIGAGCATVLGCVGALPIGGAMIVGGGFLAFEGIAFGVTGKMYDPVKRRWVH